MKDPSVNEDFCYVLCNEWKLLIIYILTIDKYACIYILQEIYVLGREAIICQWFCKDVSPGGFELLPAYWQHWSAHHPNTEP